MATQVKTKSGGRGAHRVKAAVAGTANISAEAEALAAEEIDRIIERLDVGIADEKKALDELLTRLRTTRIAA